METEFVKVVTIRDETYHTYRTIQLTKNAILNLRGEYLVYRDALNHNKNIELYKLFIIFVKTINEAINRFKIDKIIMDDKDDKEKEISQFYGFIRSECEGFDNKKYFSEQNTPEYEFFSSLYENLSDYSYSCKYELLYPSSVKDYNYKSLIMILVFPEDEEPDEYEEDIDDEIDEDIDEPEKEIIDDLYEFPVHKTMLKELIGEIRRTNNKIEKVRLLMYCQYYMEYLDVNNLDGEYLNDYNKLGKLIKIEDKILQNNCSNYKNFKHIYTKDVDIIYRKEPSEYNDMELFIIALFEKLLMKKDIYFFNDLKNIFKSYATDDKETCMYIVKDITNLLSESKMNKEIECIKNIVTDKNVVEFVSNIFTYFEMTVYNDAEGKFFGKDFFSDINGFNRNSD